MAGGSKTVKALKELEAQLQKEISDLQLKLAGVQMGIRAAGGEPAAGSSPARAKPGRKRNVKAFLLDWLEERGSDGLNAAEAIKLAQARGVPMERATVSSLLSRFKADGTVTYDQFVYRLPKYSNRTTFGDPSSPNVVHHPASKSAS